MIKFLYTKSSGSSLDDYLKCLCQDMLKKKSIASNLNEKYEARLNEELNEIKKYQLAGSFLIHYDLKCYANEQHIAMEVLNSNLSGSLVAYVLGITRIDPLKYGLFVECVLNQNKPSVLNLNIFVDNEKVELVITYLKKTYGISDIVPSMVNEKTGFNELKYFDLQTGEAELEEIKKDYKSGMSRQELKNKYNNNSKINKSIDCTDTRNDLVRLRPHPSATLILNDELMMNIPIDSFYSQNICLLDQEDLNEAGIAISKFEPNSFDEFVNFFAMYRPGLECIYNDYLQNKNNNYMISIHPVIDEVTNYTLIYREQFITICHNFANITNDASYRMYLDIIHGNNQSTIDI